MQLHLIVTKALPVNYNSEKKFCIQYEVLEVEKPTFQFFIKVTAKSDHWRAEKSCNFAVKWSGFNNINKKKYVKTPLVECYTNEIKKNSVFYILYFEMHET